MDGITEHEVARRHELLERSVGTWVPRSLAAVFDWVAQRHPDRPYVITEEVTLTYSQVQRRSVDLAGGLIGLGVRPGDRVALLVDNRPEYVEIKLAIARAGAIAVPLNYSYTGDEVVARLVQARAQVLITVDATLAVNFLAMLDEALPGWQHDLPGRRLPQLRHVVTVGSIRQGAVTLDDLAARSVGADQVAASCQSVASGAVCDIVFTSGTTGRVVGAELTHDMVLRSAYGSAYHRAFDDGWRISFALPLYHVFGYIEGMLAAMFVGGAIVLQRLFNPKTVLAQIETHRVNEVLFVPTMTIAVVDLAARGGHDLSSLQSVFSAASPAPTWLWKRVMSDLQPAMIFTGYGQTEVSAATALTYPGDGIEVVASVVGAPKLAGVAAADAGLGGRLAQYRTLDPFSHAPLPPGEPGELSVRGPQVTRRYLDDPERTAEMIDEDGWLRTGDLGHVDDRGYLRLAGRSSELFKVGGELVAPTEVEAVLTGYDGVSQAYVIGVPDERFGQVGWAYVVPVDGETIDVDALLAHTRRHVARFKVPRGVTILGAEELSTTSTGKIQKFQLRGRTDRS